MIKNSISYKRTKELSVVAMDVNEIDRAMEIEMERGADLMEQSLSALSELHYLLKKFKLYRNAKKFYKVRAYFIEIIEVK